MLLERAAQTPWQRKQAICWWEITAFALILAFSAGALFWEAILLDRPLLPVDILYRDPVFRAHAPEDFEGPSNILLFDQAYVFYPWRAYAQRMFCSGRLPLWNPYTYCGIPFVAEDQEAVFYPLNLLAYLWPLNYSFLLTSSLKILIAGLGAYIFARMLGTRPIAAALSGLAFAFSGFVIVWLGHPHSNVAVWMPALFAGAEWLYQRRDLPRTVVLGFLVAMPLLGGHAETTLYVFLAMGLYYLFRVSSPRPGGRLAIALAVFGGAVLLGFALAALHLFPFSEWLSQSAELAQRTGEGGLVLLYRGFWRDVLSAITLVFPNFYGSPVLGTEYRSLLPTLNYVEQNAYVGILPLLLAVVSVARKWEDRRVQFFAVLGFGSLAMALRLPLFSALNGLPLLNLAHSGRLRLVYTFCVAMLAGLASEDLLRAVRTDRAWQQLRILLLTIVIGGPLLFLVTRVALEVFRPWFLTDKYGQSLYGNWLMHFDLRNVATNPSLTWPIFIALGCFLVIHFYQKGRLGERLAFCFLVLLTALDLLLMGVGFHPTIDEQYVFPATEALTFLQNKTPGFRVAATHDDFMPNSNMLYGLPDVRGIDYPLRRYYELFTRLGGQDFLTYGLLVHEVRPVALGMLGVKYILSSYPMEEDLAEYLQPVFADGQVTVYENRAYLPRGYMVHRADVLPDSAALARVADDDFDPSAVVVVSEPIAEGPLQGDPTGIASSARLMLDEPCAVEFEIEAAAPGLLVLSDNYYPGWQAYLDGGRVHIYRANYAFRAVYVPEGQHKVTFRFESYSFRLGVLVSLLALLTALLALMVWARQRGMEKSQ
ncbi:MAG: YfhO family protein [Chloroflexi bacterium]|nr:YfhO family protein [Chloroflexota bacterium]